MVIFHCYVSLPEGIKSWKSWKIIVDREIMQNTMGYSPGKRMKLAHQTWCFIVFKWTYSVNFVVMFPFDITNYCSLWVYN